MSIKCHSIKKMVQLSVRMSLSLSLLSIFGCESAEVEDEMSEDIVSDALDSDDDLSVQVEKQKVSDVPVERDDLGAIITPGVGIYGTWGNMHLCQDGTYARYFRLKVEPSVGSGDDTALNGIQLYCTNRYGSGGNVVESRVGVYGTWGGWVGCPIDTNRLYTNRLRHAQLRFEPSQGGGDDTTANDLKMACESGSILESDNGMVYGSWLRWKTCPSGQVICGVKTRVEGSVGSGDDTMLNGVQFQCCYEWGR